VLNSRGRKPLFLVAIAVFLIGSALGAFAASMPMLAVFRAFQGIGAGGIRLQDRHSPGHALAMPTTPPTSL